MISKKTFTKVMKLVKEQGKIYDKVNDALELMSDSYVMVGTKDKNSEALMIVLAELFDDSDDFIGWWLYENVEKKITYADSDRIIWVKTEGQLYDFLLENMKENK